MSENVCRAAFAVSETNIILCAKFFVKLKESGDFRERNFFFIENINCRDNKFRIFPKIKKAFSFQP